MSPLKHNQAWSIAWQLFTKLQNNLTVLHTISLVLLFLILVVLVRKNCTTCKHNKKKKQLISINVYRSAPPPLAIGPYLLTVQWPNECVFLKVRTHYLFQSFSADLLCSNRTFLTISSKPTLSSCFFPPTTLFVQMRAVPKSFCIVAFWLFARVVFPHAYSETNTHTHTRAHTHTHTHKQPLPYASTMLKTEKDI